MLTRRQFLEHTLKSSSLVALSSMVPGFLASTAQAATPGKDTVLVVLEMTGGNDGLNTVIPYGDDLYHKARPTLHFNKKDVVRVDDHIGLHPGLRNFQQLIQKGQLAILQGVGYPNPNRSHFESMDIWQTADPKLNIGNGWMGRSMSSLTVGEGQMPAVNIGTGQLPLALQGSATAVPSIHPKKPYDLHVGGQVNNQPEGIDFAPPVATVETKVEPGGKPKEQTPEQKHRASRKMLVKELAQLSPAADQSMLQFVQRSALQTYTTIDRLREITSNNRQDYYSFYYAEAGRRYGELTQDLNLVARMIQSGFGTRLFYLSIGGFDTHANQGPEHQQLMQEIANAVTGFFNQLQAGGHDKRVLVMTFSEFGRRVKENSSKGTDHGAASCMFLAGPGVNGGLIGKHPALDNLDDGDLKYHTDFRQVYATLLDDWLDCASHQVLGGKFERLPLLKKT